MTLLLQASPAGPRFMYLSQNQFAFPSAVPMMEELWALHGSPSEALGSTLNVPHTTLPLCVVGIGYLCFISVSG